MKINNCEAVQKVTQQLQIRHKANPSKTQSKKPTEMADASVGKEDVSMQTATCTRSVCALRTSAGRQQTYFIIIKATDFIHVQLTAFRLTEGDSLYKLQIYWEEWTRNIDGFWWWVKGRWVNVEKLWTALIWLTTKLLSLQTASAF